jgi:surfeit locus 1 family protein
MGALLRNWRLHRGPEIVRFCYTPRLNFSTSNVTFAPTNGAVETQNRQQGSKRTWSGLLLLAPAGIAAYLGKWQLDRRHWKEDLIRERKSMFSSEDVVELFSQQDALPEYTRVNVSGVMLHSRTMFVGPRPRTIAGITKQGYLAVTPLIDPKNEKRGALIIEGWVPASWRDGRSNLRPQHTSVRGIIHCGETPSQFVPDNEPDKGNWFSVKQEEMARYAGIEECCLVEAMTDDKCAVLTAKTNNLPTTMDILAGRGAMPRIEETYPLPRSMGDLMEFSVSPQDHLNYAATWFTLSSATAVLAVKAIRQAFR